MEEKNMFNDMSNLLDMMDKFQSMNNKSSHSSSSNEEINKDSCQEEFQKEFANSNYSPAIKIINAVLPHMPKVHQKTWLIMLKTLELQELFNDYSNSESEFPKEDDGWKRKALASAKPLLPSENHEMIDKIIQIMDLKETFAMMQNLNS